MASQADSDQIAEFLSWLAVEKGRSTNTLAAYRRDLRAYSHFVTGRGTDVGGVDAGVVADYVAFLRAAGMKATSVSRSMAAVRGLHRFVLDEQGADHDPSVGVKLPRVPMGLPRALTEAEVASVLDAVTGDDARSRRDRAILEVLYGTGLRISELVGLSLVDLDASAGMLRAFGKGSKERLVPLGRCAALALDEWLASPGRPRMVPSRWARRGDSEAVFLNMRGGRLSRQGAWGIVQRHARAVGLGDKLSPHVLRHSCATHMLDHGADIRVVQELLGHASIATTQVYTRVSAQRLRRAYESAHPRARPLTRQ
ncbi:MAG: site-specific tyrosine recombinase [Acidimicrobiales bacterium]